MPEDLNLKQRYDLISHRIVAATPAGTPSVTLVAASKGQSVDSIENLYRLGHRDFGENYVQELLEKARDLEARGCTRIRWHFIGHLQSNKVKSLLPVVYAIHSVDSEKLAQVLSQYSLSQPSENLVPLFLEVNVQEEPSKSGVSPSGVLALAEKIAGLPGVSLLGLMCIPAPGKSKVGFRVLKELGDSCRPWTQEKLSMGMSEDFEEAIYEGATHVRVGTALFGLR